MTDVAGLNTRALDARDIADAVWLAGRIASAGQPRPEPETPRPPSSSQPPPPPPAPDPLPPEPALDAEIEPLPPEEAEPPPIPEPLIEWRPAPEPPSLPEPVTRTELPLGLEKALRPLGRRVPSAHEGELDEEATAAAVAESGIWLPVYTPAPEPPYEIVLLVDRGASMGIWSRTAEEFRLLLERQGAFRDVKTFWIDTTESDPVIETAYGTNCRPAQLADPTGHRIILTLTDGIGLAWRSGAMFRLLSQWRASTPVAVLHVAPPERWEWTGFQVESRELRPGDGEFIPVLAIQARYLRNWAQLLAGEHAVRLPVLLPPSEEDGEDVAAGLVLSAEERFRLFRATALPQAVRLAVLLAAVPLTLRVMREVQDRLLPESRTWHLAEFLLSRLVYPLVKRAEPEPDYEFAPGLRRQLLAGGSRDDTASVLRVVEDVLGPQVPVLANLRPVLESPEQDSTQPVVTAANAPFMAVLREVWEALSGPYTRLAIRTGEAVKRYRETGNKTDATSEGTGLAGEDTGSVGSSQSGKESQRIPVTTTSSEPTAIEVRRSPGQQAVWGGVPLRNVNFIGRKELLEQLHDQLAQSTTTAVLPGALHGMGGIGKSQIAVEYVYRHARDYDLIWWVPSENPSEIQASLVKLSQRLDLPVEQAVDTAVPAVLEALQFGTRFPRWLLVFDNADRPEHVRAFWPRGGAGHILVTSRNPQWSEVAAALEVDVFQREESRELLQRRNTDLGDEDADRLADVLGDLPLAVEQAAAWRAETGMATGEYLELFEEKRTELLESRPPADYEVAVEAAWNVSLDKLRDDNPGALELLEVCAFFSPEPISRAMFSGVRNIPVSQALERTLGDPIRLGRAIREITRYSLAKIDHRNDTLQLHRLVQLVLRNKLSPDDQIRVRHTTHLLLANRDPKQPDSVDYWPRYAELLPHIRAVDAVNCTDEWVRRMAINTVNYLFAFGDPAGALELAREYAEFWAEKLGPTHQDTLVVSRWWGRTLRALGRFEEGRIVAQRTLDLMRETLGDTHEETLLTMHGVASDLRAKGDFRAARDMNKLAYESALDRFGEDDPDTLAAANNYALSLRLVGDFQAARDLDEGTWRRKKIVLGEEHRHTLLTLDNWSVDLRETGDYLRSRIEQDDTVRRMRALLGDRHPMTLAAIKNLAVAYRKSGHHGDQKALTLAMEATDGFVTRYGENHPDAMSAALDLSIEHRQDGNLPEARRQGGHVRQLYKSTWGARHPFTLAAATNLAVTLRLLKVFDEARRLNEAALADMREVLGADHPFTLVCATNYASDLAAAGEFEAAYSLDKETLDRSTRALGSEHPSTLALVVNIALDLRGLGRVQEADSMKRDAVQRLRSILSSDHPMTRDAQLDHRANCDIDTMQV